jgi:SH3-like domain-containing protein
VRIKFERAAGRGKLHFDGALVEQLQSSLLARAKVKVQVVAQVRNALGHCESQWGRFDCRDLLKMNDAQISGFA